MIHVICKECNKEILVTDSFLKVGRYILDNGYCPNCQHILSRHWKPILDKNSQEEASDVEERGYL